MLTEGGTPEDFEDVLTYGKDGAGEIDGWEIHLLLIPRYEKAETDAEKHGRRRGGNAAAAPVL